VVGAGRDQDPVRRMWVPRAGRKRRPC